MMNEKQFLMDFLKFHYKENPFRKELTNERDVEAYLSSKNDGKPIVSGWQDFDLVKPQQEQTIIILKQNGEVGSAIYDDWFLEKARRLKHKWIPMPA